MRLELNKMTRQSGMTLLELSFAVFVILFGLLGIISMYPAAIELADRSLDVSDGAMVAKYAKYDMLLHKDDMDLSARKIIVWPSRAEVYRPDSSRLYREGIVDGLLSVTGASIKQGDHETRAVGIRCKNPEGKSLVFTGCFTNRPDPKSHKCDYYLLMTSGPAKGRVYPIEETIKGTNKLVCITREKNDPNIPGAKIHVDLNYDGISEGDTYRILGWAGKTACWPKYFTSGHFGKKEHIARKLPRNGDTVFTYGIIISPPEQDSDGACRIDIFCYRYGQFRYNVPIYTNPKPFAWNVSHVSVY